MDKKLFNQLFPGALRPGTIEPFLHKGEWAIHEVLPILLEQIGTVEVKIATFSISEDGLRPLFFLVDDGSITELKMVLDMTVKRHKLDMLLFASNITANIRLDSNHSKILLVKSSSHAFGIVGSSNLNQPRRYEAGFYFSKGTHFDYFDSMFDKMYNDATLYELNG